MTPTPDQMKKIREFAVSQLLGIVPFCRDCSHPEQPTHLANYQAVVEATGYKWTPGAKGTTCGFLCHWLLDQIGAINADIVNWDNPKRGTKYTGGGNNISKLYHGGMAPFNKILLIPRNPFSQAPVQNGPQPGDIVHIAKLDGNNQYVVNSDHVFVFLSNDPKAAQFQNLPYMKPSATPAGANSSPLIWVTAESGQGPTGRATDALFKSRAIHVNPLSTSKISLEDPDNRYITGWLDLSKLDYDATRVGEIC
ncbi:MAG: hypothetical protein ABS79_02785 [Planctomycetes bacterium SCN 63-9]|nr:MAG: hypothetical protein ABS79_02785 [Planctomycetes bacterium SCN 63-9]